MTRLLVQKYGSSVLAGDAAFRLAAQAIARTVRAGRSIVAVVSAVRGATDALLDRARGVGETPLSAPHDLLLATGELQSVALLAIALESEGVPALARNPWQIGLRTDGERGGARLRRVNPLPIRAALADAPVVVVPGFVARTDDDTLTTLGRGGSDLTAIALADALDAEACEFWKDVPGLFSADPGVVRGAVHRPRVSVAEALELARFGCRLLQDRALERAATARCPVAIRALDDERSTDVVAERSREASRVLALASRRDDVSLVGDVGRETAAESLRVLSEAGIAATLADASPSRLTFRVSPEAAVAALRLLHDHWIHREPASALASHDAPAVPLERS
jgi:aspartate kinase